MTTIILTILVIGLLIDAILDMRQHRQIDANSAKLRNLEAQFNEDFENINKRIKSLAKANSQDPNPRVSDGRITSLELSINNLSADLDRAIGTIDQVQEKIAEINVTLENITNELNRQRS
jgi:chromosome segregation ATPase